MNLQPQRFSPLGRVSDFLMNRPFWGLFTLSFLGYFTSLRNGFMLDDYLVLFNESGVSNKTFFALFTEYQHIVYRPFGHLPLWIFYQLFGTNAAAYHIANLFLFAAVCFLFFKITESLFASRPLAYLTAVLYALHPANNMLVNYVTANILSTFILTLQLSFLSAIYYLNSSQKKHLVLSLLFFLLSLFSHEMSMIYPAYVFCLVYFLRGFGIKRSLAFVLPYIGIAVLYFCFRMEFFSLKGSATAVFAVIHVFDAYISSIMALIYWYLAKMIFPRDIIFLWTAVIEEHYNPFEVYRLAGIIAVIGYLVFFRWKKGPKPFALSIFVIGLAPVFWASYAHFPFAEPLIEPHWFYFSSLGGFILLAQGILWLKEKVRLPLWRALVGAVMLMYLVLLQQNNLYWRSQETYCRLWISENGANTTPFYGMGQVFLSRGDYQQATSYLGRGFTLSRRYKSAFLSADVGYAYLQSGDTENAGKYFNAAIKREPRYSVTYYYLGLLAWQQGDKAAAEQLFSKALGLYPKSKIYNKELALIRTGQAPRGIYPLLNP